MGGFGVVYKGIQEKGGQLCAIKMIDKKKSTPFAR
jgi:serine/threonine protein kinase